MNHKVTLSTGDTIEVFTLDEPDPLAGPDRRTGFRVTDHRQTELSSWWLNDVEVCSLAAALASTAAEVRMRLDAVESVVYNRAIASVNEVSQAVPPWLITLAVNAAVTTDRGLREDGH